MQIKVEQMQNDRSPCGCGRSPTGNCIGWHALTEDQYWERLQEHNRSSMSTQVAGIDERYG